MDNIEFLNSLFPGVVRELDAPRNPTADHHMTFWANSKVVVVTFRPGTDQFGVDLLDDTNFGAGSENVMNGREKTKERIHDLLFGF